MNTEELSIALAPGHELRGVEFKAARPRTDKLFFARVIRAALGMSNRRDGGHVIIGVEEIGGTLDPSGLSGADLASWRYDDVAAALSEYADPNVSFELEQVPLDGKKFVVLRVYEFDELPTLCSKDYQSPSGTETVLRRGACYVRSRHKPETSEIPSQEEMRELLELAIDKGVRRFLSRLYAVGLSTETSPSDAQLFDRQLGDLA